MTNETPLWLAGIMAYLSLGLLIGYILYNPIHPKE